MKKILFSLLLCFALIPSYALNWGLEAEMAKTPSKITNITGQKEQGIYMYGANLFFEKEWEKSGLGFKVGVLQSDNISQPKSGYYQPSSGWLLEVPVTVYYKYKLAERFQVLGGFGVAYSTWEGRSSVYDVFWHINLGAEWYLTEWFSLVGNFAFINNATMEEEHFFSYGSSKTKIDLSGTRYGLSAKIYF